MQNNALFELFKAIFSDEDMTRVKGLATDLANELMVAERAEFLGAESHQRTPERRGYANGFKKRTFNSSRFGSLDLLHPQTRGTGKPFHSELFERYQRSEKALFIAAAEMYYKGLSTRKIRDLFADIFETRISPQFISRAATKIDDHIRKWKAERIDMDVPFLIVDAVYLKARENSRVQSKGVLIVSGIQRDGHRRVLDFSVDDLESEETWRGVFIRLRERGLSGVKMVVSDAHKGLKNAIQKCFHSSSWQRCTVHFIRNYRKKLKKQSDRIKVIQWLKNAYNSVCRKDALEEMRKASAYLRSIRKHRIATALEEEFEDTIQYMAFSAKYWRRLKTSNFMERLNGELKRRIYSIRIFPNVSALERLVGAILVEQDEQWRYGRRYITIDEADIYDSDNDEEEIEREISDNEKEKKIGR